MQQTKKLLFSFFIFLSATLAHSASYTVINTNSLGSGSFHEAIEKTNANPGADTILFNIPQSGEHVFVLDQLLPPIRDKVFIDGLSQNNFIGVDSSQYLIKLVGQGSQPHGLIIVAGSDFSTITHLKFEGFIAAAVLIEKTSNIHIYSSYFEANEIAVFINNASFNSIGDGTVANKNTITASKTDGVIIVGNSQGNDLNHNSIFNNFNLGIDLGDDAHDTRDVGDVDTGPNGFQNRPLLDSVIVINNKVTFYVTHIGVKGNVRFDFYSNDTRDTSKSSGETFLGSKTLPVVDGDVFNQTFTFNSLHRSFSVLYTFEKNTSEFSNLVLKPGLAPPISKNDTFIIDEDQASIFNVLANDVDDNLDSSSIVLIAPMSVNGQVEVVGNRVLYTPNKDYNGKDTFRYKVCDLTDREPYCDSALVFVTINAKNDPPVAVADSVGAPQASVVIVDIASNDTDPENNIDKSSISIVKSVSAAVISVNNRQIGEIKIDYSLIPFFKGRDTITYTICDRLGLCDTGFVFVLVNTGHYPSTKKDYLTLLEDQVKTVDVLANDSDIDDNLNRSSVTIVKNGKIGIATYNSDLERVSYRPNLNYNGFDTVVYRVCDFTLNCAEDTVFITISSQDDPPQVVRVNAKTIQGNCKNILVIDVLKEVIEPDENDSLDYSSFKISESISGISPSKDAKGKLVFDYSTVPNFYGLDSLQYKICDTQGFCDSSFVVIDVAFNPVPKVVNDKTSLKQGASVVVEVLKNDVDNKTGLDRTTLKIITPLKHGVAAVTIEGAIKINYSTNHLFKGNEVLTYEICDSSCFCATGKLEIKVTDTSTVTATKMVLRDDTLSFKAGCVKTSFNVLTNDSLYGVADLSTISLVPFPKSFLWTLSTSGELSANYFLDTIYEQQFNISYQLCDTLNFCDTAILVVKVLKNEPPTLNTVFLTIPQKNPSTSYMIEVLGDAYDEDGIDKTSLAVIKNARYGSSLITAKNQIKYNIGFIEDSYKTDTIVFQLCDLSCNCVTETVIIQFEEKEKTTIYEGFSPNGDGLNDFWTIDHLSIDEVTLVQIYNKWGSVVYETNQLSVVENGIWDGEKASDGVYYFVIKFKDLSIEPLTGTILLQR